jgi:hypothetical protein
VWDFSKRITSPIDYTLPSSSMNGKRSNPYMRQLCSSQQNIVCPAYL